jgi:short subunit dehydrogenase-like uncharacterized protein
MEKSYDIIIWGASGFTGRLVIDYIHQNQSKSNLTWAVAGRNESKLKEILGEREVPILIADSHDKESLVELVKQTKVILTTVGPYARYGSELVEACAENGTHYCDLTGEVHWMRDMITKYQVSAKDSGARIVHTCGFDSIPSDIGVYFLQKKMKEIHGVNAKHIKYRTRGFSGGASGGTVDSLMSMMEQAKQDSSILKTISNPYALNDKINGQDGPDKMAPFFDEDFDAWVGPFIMAGINTRVVRRTNELLNQIYGEDFRYDEGSITGKGPGGLIGATTSGLVTGGMSGMAAFSPTRTLMQKFLPKPGEGPSEETMEKGYFEVELLGIHPDDRSKDLRVWVEGDKDPGYRSTSKMIAESAMALAQDNLNVGGGFWTPASAMGDSLIKRLPDAGVTFKIIEK